MIENTDSRLKHLFFFGRLLSPLYGFLMARRSDLYRSGMLRQHRLEVPVISVGNLVMGGTGKTPLVHYIARLLQQSGHKPAILSRGYKGSAAAAVNVVSDGGSILLHAAEAGDEPRLLAEKLPGVPVITGRKRFVTGRYAIDTFGADVLILDDGFQHLTLKRDLDLVLFTASKLLGNGRVLPGGELREPAGALKRADAFVITSTANLANEPVHDFISMLDALYPEKPRFTGTYQPATKLIRIYNGKRDTIETSAAAKLALYAFCGIARPHSFKQTLAMTGMHLTGFQALQDHQAYSSDTILSLQQAARNSGATGLITTEKDLVKLQDFLPDDFPLLVLPVELRLQEDFDRFLTRRLAVPSTIQSE